MIDRATVDKILDAADIVDVLTSSTYVAVAQTMWDYVLFTTKRRPHSAYLAQKAFASVLVAAKVVAQLTLLWNMSKCLIMKPLNI